MLTVDLVKATKRGKELHVKPLAGKARERAVELATEYCAIAATQVGQPRESLLEAWAAVHTASSEKKLSQGLQKLIEDACDFESEAPVEPQQLRGEVFLLAAQAWKQAELVEHFARDRVLKQAGAAHGLEPSAVEEALYADLRAAQLLHKAPKLSPEGWIDRYNLATVQAVLLRAVKVRATVRCSGVDAYRALFRRLKFHRLLYTLTQLADGSTRIDIDGPFSLFEHVTKYGLQLALVLPALRRADSLQLEADVRWGKSRQALTFTWQSQRSQAEVALEASPPDEIVELVAAFRKLDSGWKVSAASALIDLPGVGLCVPDLTFTSPTGAAVHFELLGYWSRDAVWKRIEIAQARKAGAPLLFAVSSRLRVSEAVLKDEDNAALYVFKGVMSAKAVLRHLERIAGE